MNILHFTIFGVLQLFVQSEGKLKLDLYPDLGICDGRDDWSAKTVNGEFIEIGENKFEFNGSVNFITNM